MGRAHRGHGAGVGGGECVWFVLGVVGGTTRRLFFWFFTTHTPHTPQLDKPHGVPSVPTVDNGVEHAIGGAARGLAWLATRAAAGDPTTPRPLTFDADADADSGATAINARAPRSARRRRASGSTPVASGDAVTHGLAAAHRLDQAACGLLILSASRSFLRAFGVALAAGALAKCYRAAFVGEGGRLPPLGRVTHWASSVPRGPGTPAHTVMRAEQSPGAARCDLVVLSVRRVTLSPAALATLSLDAASSPPPTAHEAAILLLTGRTHQVRAQMAALGCPLLGDGLYGQRGVAEGEVTARRSADAPVALQAARLSGRAGGPFGAADVAFTAGAPWWRGDVEGEPEGEFQGADEAWGTWMEEKAEARETKNTEDCS